MKLVIKQVNVPRKEEGQFQERDGFAEIVSNAEERLRL
jgi:hypothetical protein